MERRYEAAKAAYDALDVPNANLDLLGEAEAELSACERAVEELEIALEIAEGDEAAAYERELRRDYYGSVL